MLPLEVINAGRKHTRLKFHMDFAVASLLAWQ